MKFNLHSDERIFWFDSETTGFHEKQNQMLSAAVVCTDTNFKVIDHYYRYIQLKPNTIVTQQALDVNKIDLKSPLYLNNALPEKQVMFEMTQFVNKYKTKKSLALAHNAPFDERFINYAMDSNEVENFLKELNKVLCTIKFFRKNINAGKFQTVLLDDLKNPGKQYWSAKLEHITKALNIKHTSHDALGDTLGLIEAYQIVHKLDTGLDFFEIY